MTERKSRLSRAAATSLLQGAVDVRLGTVLRWIVLAAIPIIPVMVELADWPKWVDPPLLPAFHIIYWWALLVLAVGLWEIGAKGKKRVEWLVYWQERARNLAGNIEEIGENLLGSSVGGGKPASPDRIVAGILQQIVDVVEYLQLSPWTPRRRTTSPTRCGSRRGSTRQSSHFLSSSHSPASPNKKEGAVVQGKEVQAPVRSKGGEHVNRPKPRGRMGKVSLLRRIGTYLWIGLVDPAPPRVPGQKPRK